MQSNISQHQQSQSADTYDTLLTILPPIIMRRDIEKLLYGLMTRGHLANLDSRGEGPPKLQVGRYIAYPRESFVSWLKNRYGK